MHKIFLTFFSSVSCNLKFSTKAVSVVMVVILAVAPECGPFDISYIDDSPSFFIFVYKNYSALIFK